MTQICFYLDEDTIENALIRALRNADLDVITVTDVGRLGFPDEEQLIWATEQKRAIYSFNRGDFCRLHQAYMAEGKNHSGIVLATQQQLSIGQQLRGLLRLAATRSAEEIVNQLVFLSNYIGESERIIL